MRKNTSFSNDLVHGGTIGNYIKKSALFLLALFVLGFTSCNNDDEDQVVTPQGNVIDDNDVEFATKAGQWNRAQIEFGELALQKSSHDEVKAYAQSIIDHHTAAQDELMNLLAGKGINFVDTMEDDDQELFDHISKQGEDFDEKFMDDQENRLKKMEDEYEDYEDNGDDQDLKNYATKHLPVIKDNRNKADDLEEKVD